MLRIYTRTTCAYCKMVKKILNLKELEYETINLDEQPATEIERVIALSGKTTVPVVTRITDNNESLISAGWEPNKLTAL